MNTVFKTIFFLFLGLVAMVQTANTKEIILKKVLIMDINSSINPSTYNYLSSGNKKAIKNGYDLILIKMNTPGGLVSTTKEILTMIGSSQIPYAIWVTPEGGSATSAGAIIASGAHFLFMSPGTNIGAATPISMTGKMDKDSDLRKKAINDLVALVKSLAKNRGRNQELFSEMISEASSFDSDTAKEKNLIDEIINKEGEIWNFLDGKTTNILGEKTTMNSKSSTVIVDKHEMDIGQILMNIFANPAAAYILFLIGAALIYLELQAPGGFIAGSIGALALILAGIGFQIIPINFGALGLIILSFILFILEMYVTSYGVLSLAGLGSLIVGSLFLFRTDETYIVLNPSIIFSAVAAITLFLFIIGYFLIKDLVNRKKIGEHLYTMIGKEATITKINPPEIYKGQTIYTYQLKVEGETWNATSNTKYVENDKVEILKHNSKKILLEC